MRAIQSFVMIAIATSLLTSASRAQDSTRVITSPPITRDEVGTLDLAIGGVRGGFAGAGIGAGVGLVAGAIGCRSGSSGRDWCTLTYGLGGTLVGLVVGTPVGVHAANHGRGNLISTAVGSIAVTVALIAVGSTLTRGNGPPFVLTLPLEIGSAISIERYTERH